MQEERLAFRPDRRGDAAADQFSDAAGPVGMQLKLQIADHAQELLELRLGSRLLVGRQSADRLDQLRIEHEIEHGGRAGYLHFSDRLRGDPLAGRRQGLGGQ